MELPRPTILDIIYTEDEAAARLRLTRRSVVTLGRRYGCCSVHGRILRFSEQDLLDLWQMLRATAKGARPKATTVPMDGVSYVFFRDQARRRQQEREERARQRKAREADARERRLEEQRQAARAKAEQRNAKREAKAREAAAKRAAKAVVATGIDRKNRDPAYWTDERKKAIRRERVARMQAWVPIE
ncbi:hypothetical protein [Mesorhizobium sp.]|uniref:hypothetical protein n=1 Tax=Mesorhizobium sp. TaxID=1871066 RepID=UPI000FE4BE00|nr:hypothetical protein [Mesorhizobium sp.]RWB65438.1 MAG: hypothetical protein EOQ49_32065 [Mesorhizobium sp.]